MHAMSAAVGAHARLGDAAVAQPQLLDVRVSVQGHTQAAKLRQPGIDPRLVSRRVEDAVEASRSRPAGEVVDERLPQKAERSRAGNLGLGGEDLARHAVD